MAVRITWPMKADTPLVLNQNVIIIGNGAVLDGSGDHGPIRSPGQTGLILGPGAENVAINDLTVQNFETVFVLTSDGGCLSLDDILL